MRVVLEEEGVDCSEYGGEVMLSWVGGGGRLGRRWWWRWEGCFDRVDEGSETISMLEVVG